jgi:hypothetical protein
MESMKALVTQSGSRYRFIGLSLSSERLTDYIRDNSLPFPVYSHLSPDTVKTYKLGSTPATIVVSTAGRVLGVWNGAFGGPAKSELENFFSARLPELKKPNPKSP